MTRLSLRPTFLAATLTASALGAATAEAHCGCEDTPAFQSGVEAYEQALMTRSFDWQPLPDQAAVLVVSSHPDDEGIFFGGALPYYSQVRNLPTVLISMTSGDYNLSNQALREQELRNAAQVYGLDYEPLFPRFRDYWFGTGPGSADSTFDIWNDGISNNGDAAQGRVLSATYIATQIRLLRPEVVLGHDFEGEYGHGNHRAAAIATADAWAIASDPNILLFDDQGQELAPWTPSKMYLHLYDEDPGNLSALFHTGWEDAYPELDGLTPRQVANLGLAEHASQNGGNFRVSTWFPPGADGESFDGYDSERWGLYATTVGADPETSGFAGQFFYGDFFNNVDLTPFAAFLADSNGDNIVDIQDLEFLLANWGEAVPAGSVASGDADGDGVIGQGDLDLLIAGWGEGTAPPFNIPEPGSLALLAVLLLANSHRRRKPA